MINAVVIDDEPNVLALIENYLNTFFDQYIVVLDTFTNSVEAFNFCKNHTSIDVVFIDINMPRITGLEFLEAFPARSFEVVFVTAYSEYALNAYKSKALDYILKPIDRVDFISSVTKVIERVNKLKSTNVVEAPKRIAIPKNGITLLVELKELLYIKAEGSYSKIVTQSETHVISRNLKKVLQLLPDQDLIKINRSYVANRNGIKGYNLSTGGTIIMKDGHEIGISRSLRKSVLASLNVLSNS